MDAENLYYRLQSIVEQEVGEIPDDGDEALADACRVICGETRGHIAASKPIPEPVERVEIPCLAPRFNRGDRLGMYEGVIIRRIVDDTYLVKFHDDGKIAGVLQHEIHATCPAWEKIRELPETFEV